MKIIYRLALACILLSSCTEERYSVVNGNIDGFENDTILVFARDMVNAKFLSTDTVPLMNGKFCLEYPDTTVITLQVVEKPTDNRAIRMPRNMGIILLPGDKIEAKGKIDNLMLSGSQLYDELNKVEEVLEGERVCTSVADEWMKLYADERQDKQRIDSVMSIYKEKVSIVSKAKMSYINSHPNSLASAYYVLSLKAEEGVKACQMLGSEIRNGVMKEVIDRVEKGYKDFLSREENKRNIKPGKPAPDFKLKNLHNKMVSLEAFKGKYVILDFWGTWCGWCIKGMPRMKEYYSKYKDRVEIVGISCRDTEDKWRQGVDKYQLPWVNLFNGNDSGVVNKYAVPGFPTKILIDPQGIIVGVYVGESEEIYKALDKLFQ